MNKDLTKQEYLQKISELKAGDKIVVDAGYATLRREIARVTDTQILLKDEDWKFKRSTGEAIGKVQRFERRYKLLIPTEQVMKDHYRYISMNYIIRSWHDLMDALENLDSDKLNELKSVIQSIISDTKQQ